MVPLVLLVFFAVPLGLCMVSLGLCMISASGGVFGTFGTLYDICGTSGDICGTFGTFCTFQYLGAFCMAPLVLTVVTMVLHSTYGTLT